MRVIGNSMYPALIDQQIVAVIPIEKYTKAKLKVGDILVFQRLDGSYIVHRIVRIHHANDHTVCETKGDHNVLPDPYFAHEGTVIGVVDI